MARETKRMALYEAIRKGQSKGLGGHRTVSIRSGRTAASRWAGRRQKRAISQMPESPSHGERKSAVLRDFLSKRMEFSLSYLTVGLLAGAFFVAFAGAVRLGQVYHDRTLPFMGREAPEQVNAGPGHDLRETLFPKSVNSVQEKPGGGEVKAPVGPEAGKLEEPAKTVKKVVAPVKAVETPVVPQGNNIIVIQEYFKRQDLVPVQEHFASKGIGTEILERRSYFFLVTKASYNSFSLDKEKLDPDRDGDMGILKIREAGASYKAPAGFDSFRPNLFRGAYGAKVKLFYGE